MEWNLVYMCPYAIEVFNNINALASFSNRITHEYAQDNRHDIVGNGHIADCASSIWHGYDEQT